MARQKNDGKGRMGGRTQGTPNKVSALTKAAIQSFLDDHQEEAWKAWEKITSPKQKFEMYIRLCEFVVPKMASVEFNAGDTVPDWMSKLQELREKK